MKSSNPFARQFAERRSANAKQAADKAQAELGSAENDWISEARKLEDLRGIVSAYLEADALVDVAALETVAAKPLSAVKKAPATTQTIDTTNNGIQSAVLSGKTYVAIALIQQKKIDIHHQNGEGNTALHLAVAQEDGEVVKELVRAGAKQDTVNKEGKTPAALAKGKESMERLLAGK
jgi:ankyrin repeat protein